MSGYSFGCALPLASSPGYGHGEQPLGAPELFSRYGTPRALEILVFGKRLTTITLPTAIYVHGHLPVPLHSMGTLSGHAFIGLK